MSGDLFNYYGIDLAAMVLTFLSIVLLGRKRKEGFLLGAVAGAFWLIASVMADMKGSVIANAIMVPLQLHGWWNWHRAEGSSDAEPT
jgi:nicotinamide riboside transporter PnuC